jgi:hypothetical protein
MFFVNSFLVRQILGTIFRGADFVQCFFLLFSVRISLEKIRRFVYRKIAY